MPTISVVVPVYQGEATLPELYSRLRAALETVTSDFEIILVEDGSPDGSWRVILNLAEADRRVKGVHFTRNFGQHHAITAGIDLCGGDWVVIMDCDLQDPPEAIPQLYAKAAEGYDVVLARRQLRHDHVAKRAASWLFYKVLGYLTDIKWDRKIGVFRIMSKTAVEQFRQLREQMRFTVGLIDWLGFPTASVDVEHSERLQGRSTYTPRTLWRLASAAIIAYSDKPLRLAIQLGFTISLLAFAGGIYIVARYVAYGSVITGWSSLIVSVFFMGGIIVSILGMIGIYLGRVFDETKGRPLYVIRRRVNL